MNNYSYCEWKWSKGELYYKSTRQIENKNKNNDNNNELNAEKEYLDIINTTAIKQSLDGFSINDEYFDSFGFDPKFSRNENPNGNRREDLDNKMSDRELLFQRGTNPFLQTTNYVNDIVARDTYLKPQNTSIDKISENNN
jgi:hypothetical protein